MCSDPSLNKQEAVTGRANHLRPDNPLRTAAPMPMQGMLITLTSICGHIWSVMSQAED